MITDRIGLHSVLFPLSVVLHSVQLLLLVNVYFLITGDKQDGILHDTRNIAVKGPYLFCRTHSELVINVEIQLLGESSHAEPVYFIFYARSKEMKSWGTLLVSD